MLSSLRSLVTIVLLIHCAHGVEVEPTWMHLGEASGMAASLAIKNKQAVQEIDVPNLQDMIKKQRIPLEIPDLKLNPR